MRLTVKVVLGLLVLSGAMYLFAFPTRTYLQQRHEIALQEHSIAVLAGENAKLSAETAALQSDATIEEIARQDYGLVMPGQQAFMVLPSAATPAPRAAAHHKPGPWYRSLEFWDQF